MNTALTFLNNIVYRVLNIAVTYGIVILMSKLAGVEGYGLLSLLIVNATFFNLVSGFGADAGITYYSANSNLNPGKILTIITFIIAIQLILLGIIEFAGYHFTHHYWLFKNGSIAYWWIGFLFLLSISLTEKYTALFNGHTLFIVYSKILFLTNLLMLLVFCCIYFWFGAHNFLHLVIIYTALCIFQSMALMYVFHRHLKKPFRFSFTGKKDIKVFLSFSVVTLAANFIQFLCYRMDYWFVDYLKGEKELGWYAFAVRLVQAFWIVPVLFAGILFTRVAQKKNEYDRNNMMVFLRLLFFLNSVAGVLCFFLIQWIIPFIFGRMYLESIWPFRILLPGVILFCYTSILAAYFSGKGALKVNLTGSVICFCCILVLDILLIPPFGIKGAAEASSIGYAVSCAYSVSVYCRQTRTPFYTLFYPKWKDWYYLRDTIYKIIKNT